MKKNYLYLVICCMASSLFAQSPSSLDLHRKLTQNPGQLTPDILRSEISQFNDQLDKAPLILDITYNLTDSIHEYFWNDFFNNWTVVRKTIYENDCTIGKPTTTLVLLDDQGDGIFVNYSKKLTQYFDDGNDQKVETFYWHPAQQSWELGSYAINLRPNAPAEDWSKNWDSNTASFTSGLRSVYTYNNDDKLSQIEAYIWEVDTWVLNFRTTFTYANGLVTEQLGENYDAATGTWIPATKSIRTYNANGNLLTITDEANFGSGFAVLQVTTYTYNASNQQTEQLVQVNHNQGNGLENSQKTLYYYYSNGNAQGFDSFNWIPDQQDWLLSTNLSFREDGQLSSVWFKSFFGDFTGQFDFGLQIRYFYSAEGLLDYYFTDELDTQTQEWTEYQKNSFTYDGNNRQVENILQDWDETQMDFLNSYRYYNFNTGCLYSGLDEIGQPQLDNFCLHANPLRPNQPIQCSSLLQLDAPLVLSLYGMAGNRIHVQAFMPGDAFQPSQPLAPGTYLLDIRTEKGISVHRAKVVVVE